LGYENAYSILVEHEVGKRGQRKSREELFMEHIKWHNKQEKNQTARICAAEI
jgi:hypothetical protein